MGTWWDKEIWVKAGQKLKKSKISADGKEDAGGVSLGTLITAQLWDIF